MIRIAKMPYIVEDTDRWGRGLGTYSVVDIQGDIDDQMWERVQEFEGYYLSEEGQAELADAIKTGNFTTPYMNKVIGYCNSQLWQFNLRVSETQFPNASEYIRSFAIFGEKTLYAWTPEHDEKIKILKEQAANMSKHHSQLPDEENGCPND